MAADQGQTGASSPTATTERDGADDGGPAARLAHLLEREIRDAALPPGHRLGTKEELRARFRVPVGAVDAAVRTLERRGVLAARAGPRGGLFVARGLPDGRASVADCLAVRDALTPLVAGAAARHATAADLADLREIAAAMPEHGGDPAACLRAGWRLHRRIAEIAPSGLYDELLVVAERASQEAEPDDSLDLGAQRAFHHDLVEAIAARDPARVAAVAGHRAAHASDG